MTDYTRKTVDASNEFEAAAIIGQSFEHDMQPYGRRRFIVERVLRTSVSHWDYLRKQNVTETCYELSGRIYYGHQTSYLLGHRSTRDIAGTTEHVYGVELRHLAKMEKVSIAM